jgi:hypothetical protein
MPEIVFSDHALFEMERRAIPIEAVVAVVNNSTMGMPSRQGRLIIQGKYFDRHLSKEMVLRVIGTEERGAFRVITAYKTSKLEKYWKEVTDEDNIRP